MHYRVLLHCVITACHFIWLTMWRVIMMPTLLLLVAAHVVVSLTIWAAANGHKFDIMTTPGPPWVVLVTKCFCTDHISDFALDCFKSFELQSSLTAVKYHCDIFYRFASYWREELASLIARFMGPTWGPSGADRTQMGSMLAPWTLLSGM